MILHVQQCSLRILVSVSLGIFKQFYHPTHTKEKKNRYIYIAWILNKTNKQKEREKNIPHGLLASLREVFEL